MSELGGDRFARSLLATLERRHNWESYRFTEQDIARVAETYSADRRKTVDEADIVILDIARREGITP